MAALLCSAIKANTQPIQEELVEKRNQQVQKRNRLRTLLFQTFRHNFPVSENILPPRFNKEMFVIIRCDFYFHLSNYVATYFLNFLIMESLLCLSCFCWRKLCQCGNKHFDALFRQNTPIFFCQNMERTRPMRNDVDGKLFISRLSWFLSLCKNSD